MADITISVLIADVQSLVRRDTSKNTQIAAYYKDKDTVEKQDGQLQDERLFYDMLTDSSNTVLNLFISRQGDVDGVPYEKTDTEIIYRFNEGLPVLTSAPSITSRLTEAVKYAIYNQIIILFSKATGDASKVKTSTDNYINLSAQIESALYFLHD